MVVGWLRKIAAGALAYILALVLFAVSSAAVFHFTIANPEKVKGIISDSGLYDSFVDTSLSELAKNPEDSDSTIPLENPNVQRAVKKAFPPEVLRSNTEEFIDGTYDWLHGNTEQADFTLDFTESKNTLAREVGNYAQRRAAKLPPCGFRNIPDKIEAFGLKCLPPGVNAKQIGTSTTRDLRSDKNFLPDPKITPHNLAGESEEGNPFNQQELPARFQLMDELLWVLIGISVIMSAVVFFVSKDKLRGIKRISKSFLIVGIFVAITPLLLNFIANRVSNSDLLNNDISGNLVLPVMREFISAVAPVYYILGVIYISIGVGSLIFAYKSRDDTPRQNRPGLKSNS
jgi:hypothetical protein